MKNKICGVYKITSPSGKFYIGSSFDVKSRWAGHKSDLRKGKHHCEALQRAASKYGVGALVFEVLATCSTETVRQAEQGFINNMTPSYNSTDNVRESLSGLWKDPEFRAKGIARSSAQIKKLWLDPDYIERQRKGSSRGLSEMHRCPEFAAAHKVRATARLVELVNVPEIKAKAAERRRERMAIDRANPDAWAARNAKIRALLERPVLCIETGVIYKSQLEAGRWLKSALGFKSSGHINSCLKGRAKQAYGYTWAYVAPVATTGVKDE